MDKIKTVKTERTPNQFFEEEYFVNRGEKLSVKYINTSIIIKLNILVSPLLSILWRRLQIL